MALIATVTHIGNPNHFATLFLRRELYPTNIL